MVAESKAAVINHPVVGNEELAPQRIPRQRHCARFIDTDAWRTRLPDDKFQQRLEHRHGPHPAQPTNCKGGGAIFVMRHNRAMSPGQVIEVSMEGNAVMPGVVSGEFAGARGHRRYASDDGRQMRLKSYAELRAQSQAFGHCSSGGIARASRRQLRLLPPQADNSLPEPAFNYSGLPVGGSCRAAGECRIAGGQRRDTAAAI